jgi:hypothetical protein
VDSRSRENNNKDGGFQKIHPTRKMLFQSEQFTGHAEAHPASLMLF